jgi:fatty-acyl-CoA synthase
MAVATPAGAVDARPSTGTPSYAHGASRTPLLGDTIGAHLAEIARRHADAEALIVRHQGVRLSYAQLLAASDRVARGLLGVGFRAGERVGIWAPNRAEWVLMQFATARVGIILVNINPAFRATELGYALRQSGVSGLVLCPSFKGADYLDILASSDPPDSLRCIIVLDDAARDGQIGWSELERVGDRVQQSALEETASRLTPDDPINIQYTSGTTGNPKGATLTHHNLLNNGFFIGERLRLSVSDRVCIPVPFYHCFGMVLGNLACVTHASAMVIPAEAFDPLATLETVESERCTALHGVPTMFVAELEHPRFAEFDLTSLRTGIMAGSPCPVEVMRQVVSRMHMIEVTICYGMTETSPVSSQSSVDDSVELRCTTVGRVHDNVEVKIVDPKTGLTVPRGTFGEFCTRGYSVMLGYWNDDTATAAAIDRARWMHTGDLAVMDDAGYLNIVGRIKDMIIRGGENVYPREIEEFLHTHPAVSEAQVVGVPDQRYGEAICACIRLRPGMSLTEDEVRAFCRGQIAHYKTPRYVRFVESFPMTVTGKVQKFLLRATMINDLSLDPPTASA